ncbi:hypothetical protein LX36DRAFT_180034 [Colletotrichum falcatum]|nr:hypothetical protein LX36DRAFT_180034 [Colletotrichum falcatum]
MVKIQLERKPQFFFIFKSSHCAAQLAFIYLTSRDSLGVTTQGIVLSDRPTLSRRRVSASGLRHGYLLLLQTTLPSCLPRYRAEFLHSDMSRAQRVTLCFGLDSLVSISENRHSETTKSCDSAKPVMQLPGSLRFPGSSFHGMAELPTCNISESAAQGHRSIHLAVASAELTSMQCASVVNNAFLSQINLRTFARFDQSPYPTNLSLRHVLRGTTKPRHVNYSACLASASCTPSHHTTSRTIRSGPRWDVEEVGRLGVR